MYDMWLQFEVGRYTTLQLLLQIGFKNESTFKHEY